MPLRRRERIGPPVAGRPIDAGSGTLRIRLSKSREALSCACTQTTRRRKVAASRYELQTLFVVFKPDVLIGLVVADAIRTINHKGRRVSTHFLE